MRNARTGIKTNERFRTQETVEKLMTDERVCTVLFTENNQMIYMSRQLIPGTKSKDFVPPNYYKQVCIYAFSKKELIDYAEFGRKGTLEFYEDIEILRFLEIGVNI